MLLVIALAVLCSAAVMGFEAPEFCGDGPCYPYQVVKKTAEYDVRKYACSRWVNDYNHAGLYQPCDSLEEYARGYNDQNVTVALGKPIVEKVTPNLKMCRRYLPPQYYNNPPKPRREGLEIRDEAERTFIVKSFKGWVHTDDLKATYMGLKKAAKGDVVRKPYLIVARYSKPEVPDAYNEMWMQHVDDLRDKEECNYSAMAEGMESV